MELTVTAPVHASATGSAPALLMRLTADTYWQK
jgi:hypothetical protein